ncbi:ferrichrome ABC transporter substrate-binding protein [Thalassotalea insulae]|uniref:Ferrichrome ABC transporter substrate-binding protein n=1 Tax=Thalassotalea insulae TaxID=2056778 RepID=A0ABQ6GVK1_9GAMM|nr:GNAT family N-acetyltransferase [Thalassotalea insulae]GLX79902.1 ferrichrome ABC transporter substrate-binding protein [Thalassotalea insulae]
MKLLFSTSRLSVFELLSDTPQDDLSNLLALVPELLTPKVVENLPPYFHGINSAADAKEWLERMMSESRLFVVKQKDADAIIGFVFAYVENDSAAHIGYLLGEAYWRQGLASELLKAFVVQVAQTESWDKLIAGVERSNQASSALLEKLGFVEQSMSEEQVKFYQYPLH